MVSFLLNLKEKKDYNERKLEHYKIVHNKICNLCNEVNKIREDLINKKINWRKCSMIQNKSQSQC